MSRRPQALFLIAVLGVLLCLGLAIGALAGPGAAGAYALLVVVLLALGARRAQAQQQRQTPRLSDGRSCTCCTTSQHDPVKVIE